MVNLRILALRDNELVEIPQVYFIWFMYIDCISFFTWHIAHAFLNLPREMFLLMTSLSSWFVYSCTFGEISWVDNVILTSFPLCVCNETSPPNTSTGYCPDGICKDFYKFYGCLFLSWSKIIEYLYSNHLATSIWCLP